MLENKFESLESAESARNVRVNNGESARNARESFSLPIALTPKKCALIGAGNVAWQKLCAILDAKWSVSIFAREVKDSRFKPYFAEDSAICTAIQDEAKNTNQTAIQNANHNENQGEIQAEIRSETQIQSEIQNANLAEIQNEIHSANQDKIRAVIRAFNSLESLESLRGFEIVIDASGDENLGANLYKVRKERGFWLNVVDKPELCDFYFGAIARRENLAVMVTSNGASPILAQAVRDKVDLILPRALDSLSSELKDSRKSRPKINKDSVKNACQNALGKVFIIGCGPGDFSLLTLKALEILPLIEVALIDNLVGRDVWAFLEARNIACIDVGKKKGAHKFKQSEINEMLLNLAREGKIVGRLKGGDPVIFGRLFEEASFLKARGVEVECVSGVTSALSGALNSGIMPTLRGVSSGVIIVSAHLRESLFNAKWLDYLKTSPFTLIVLMAHSFAARIVAEAKAREIDLNLGAAFVSNISLAAQKTIIGRLGDLEKMAQMCENPSVLILGNAVEKSREMPYFGERIEI